MTRKLVQLKERKQGYRLVKSGSNLVNPFVQNRAVCFKNVAIFGDRLLDQYNSYGHSE
jgi:hypothetical protein